MSQLSATDLDSLRSQLSAPHRGFINALWTFYHDHNQWVPPRIAHQHFGQATVQAHLEALGSSLVRSYRDEGKEYYRLTFLGVLLADSGVEAEDLLVRYLEYVRERCRSDPRLEWVGSQDVEAALHLSAEQSRLLRQLIRLSHWWGGGSAFGDREWTVGVPVDLDDLLAEANVRRYVREHVLKHFPVASRSAGAVTSTSDDRPGGPFWFVGTPALREQLAADWHEAQDVCHVRGWKSCVILCGGILEALLADALTRIGAPEAGGRPRLPALVAAATKHRLLEQDLSLSPALQAFQALFRPGRASRKAVAPGRTEAEAALEAVRTCLRQLGSATPAPQRPEGR